MDSTAGLLQSSTSSVVAINPGPDRNWSDMVASLFSNSLATESDSEPWWCQNELLSKENMEEVANTLLDPLSALENGAMFRSGTQRTEQPNQLAGTFFVPRSLEKFNADQDGVQWKIGELQIPFDDNYQKMQIFVPFLNGIPTFLKDVTSEEKAADITSAKVELKSENLNLNNAKNDDEGGKGNDIKKMEPGEIEKNISKDAYTEDVPYEQNNPTPTETENTTIPTQNAGRKKKQSLTAKSDLSYDDRTGISWETKLKGTKFSSFTAFDPIMVVTDDKNESPPPTLGTPLKPGLYKFVCEYCHCGFHQNYKYKNHVRIHQGQRLHTCRCDRCGIPYRDYRTMSKNHNAAYKSGPN